MAAPLERDGTGEVTAEMKTERRCCGLWTFSGHVIDVTPEKLYIEVTGSLPRLSLLKTPATIRAKELVRTGPVASEGAPKRGKGIRFIGSAASRRRLLLHNNSGGYNEDLLRQD